MKFHSNRFGDIEISEESLVIFPSGLVGFPNYKRYVVLDVAEESDYQWLQSIEEPSLAFVLIDVRILSSDIRVEIPEEFLPELEIQPNDPVLLLAVVTIPSDAPEQASANLRAPLVVNVRTRKGKQLILHESLPLRFPLIPENSPVSLDQALTVETAPV